MAGNYFVPSISDETGHNRRYEYLFVDLNTQTHLLSAIGIRDTRALLHNSCQLSRRDLSELTRYEIVGYEISFLRVNPETEFQIK